MSAERFQEEMMGRSIDEAVDDRNDGVAFDEIIDDVIATVTEAAEEKARRARDLTFYQTEGRSSARTRWKSTAATARAATDSPPRKSSWRAGADR